MLIQILVFCLITPAIPRSSSGSTRRRTDTQSRCSAPLFCSCYSPFNRCVRVCSLFKIQGSSARVSRLTTIHEGATAALMSCADIGVPRFGVVGLNDGYAVRTGVVTRSPMIIGLTSFADARRICVCCRSTWCFISHTRQVLTLL
jgi:hypothetical protein